MINIVVAAAGQGTRLESLSESTPKFLLDYDGVPIFRRLLLDLEPYRRYIDKVYVVIGTKGTCWNQDSYNYYNSIINKFDFNIETVYNFNNDITCNSNSIDIGMDRIQPNSDLVIIDGDVVFKDKNIIKNIMSFKDDFIVVRKGCQAPVLKIKDGLAVSMDRSYTGDLVYSGAMRLSNRDSILKFHNILKQKHNYFIELVNPLNELFKVCKIKTIHRDDMLNINTVSDLKKCSSKRCFLNEIYYSNIEESVKLRIALGKALAREDCRLCDCVIPIPETGIHFATGYASSKHSERYTPVYFGIERKVVMGRTLFENEREKLFEKKYKIYPFLFDNRNVVLIDEAVFSGKTIAWLSEKIKKESKNCRLHVGVITPPIKNNCYMLPKITYNPEFKYIDSIQYLNIQTFKDIIKQTKKDCCLECVLEKGDTNVG